ncbi:hypothetical protein DFJ74DRAFT_260724 [Hyaloraphidium curvatum]|nr:hypothetical protein DFJ74DRAFT_260724 [Hyaloraphidium curvatum]
MDNLGQARGPGGTNGMILHSANPSPALVFRLQVLGLGLLLADLLLSLFAESTRHWFALCTTIFVLQGLAVVGNLLVTVGHLVQMRAYRYGFLRVLLREYASALTISLVYLCCLVLVRIVEMSTIRSMCSNNGSCDIWSSYTTGLYAVQRIAVVAYYILFLRQGIFQSSDFKFYASWPMQFMLSPSFVFANNFPMAP